MISAAPDSGSGHTNPSVVLRASDRKVLKPPGYSRPELRAILAAAGATPEALGEQTRV